MAGVWVRTSPTTGKKSYQLIFRGPDGLPVRITARTATSLTMARKMAQAAEEQAERERLGIAERRVERHTGDDLCDRYLADVVPGLRNQYGPKSQIKVHVRPFLTGKRLDKITPADITGWLNGLKAAGLQDSSRFAMRLRLGAMLGFAVNQLKWLNTNPIKEAERVKPAVRAPRFLTGDEVFRVLHAADEWLRPVIAVAVYCGLRKGELAGLEWEDVDLEAGVIHVRRSFRAATKSGRERVVGIPPGLVPFLEDQRQRSRGKCVFPSRSGQPRLHWALDKTFKAVLAAAGITKDVTFRHTRSTFGTAYRRATGDIRAVQRSLGHADVGTTARHYDGTDMAELLSNSAKLSYGATHKRLTSGFSEPVLSEEKGSEMPVCTDTRVESATEVIVRQYRVTCDITGVAVRGLTSERPDPGLDETPASSADSQATHKGGGR